MTIRRLMAPTVVLAAIALSPFASAQPRRDDRPMPPRGDMRPAPPPGDVRPPPPPGDIHRGLPDPLAHLRERQQQLRIDRDKQRRDAAAWAAGRAARAADRRNDLVQTWGDAANRPEARAELALHAERMATLNRILDVAQDKGDTALAARTNALIDRENARDVRIMQDIRAKAGLQ